LDTADLSWHIATGLAGRASGRRPATAAGAIVLALIVAAGAAFAAEEIHPPVGVGEVNPDSAMVRALRGIAGEPLTLERALDLAMGEATSLRAAEAAHEAARATVRSESGTFDPEIFGELSRNGLEQPATSPFSGAAVLDQEQTVTSAGARWYSPIGTEVTASLGSTRLENNSSFSLINPVHNAESRLEITQPLLRGFGPAASSELAAVRHESEAAEAGVRDARLEVRAEVEATYWELHAAERDLAVRQLLRENAAALQQEATLRSQAGLVGPGEVAGARGFRAEQELAVIDAEEALDRVSDRLGSWMGTRPGRELRYSPVDDPPRYDESAPADSLVAWALRSNETLAALQKNRAAHEERLRGARWDALPGLDLFGSIGGLGLAGTGREVAFGDSVFRSSLDTGLSDSWREALERDYATWSAGLRVSLPLGLRYGRGERDRWRAEVRRAQALETDARRALEEQVRSQHRELMHGNRRLELSREGVEATMEQVRIGLLEYRAGRSSAFELVRLAADLGAAQQRYSQALVRTARAAAQLRRLTGGRWPAMQ